MFSESKRFKAKKTRLKCSKVVPKKNLVSSVNDEFYNLKQSHEAMKKRSVGNIAARKL